ncbi:MAG: alpha/beta hydrolase family protein [Pseudonocardia sp.]
MDTSNRWALLLEHRAMLAPVSRRLALRRLAAMGASALVLPSVVASCATTGPRPAPGFGGPVRVEYGSHRSQFGELTLPAGDGPVRGVVTVVHGGFWRQAFGLELGRPLAVDLANAGFAAWNVEYRRVGGGGGWTSTFDDVAAALDLLAGPVQQVAKGRLDLDRVVAVGHSAGGHLALWLAARPGLPAGAPGAARPGLPGGALGAARPGLPGGAPGSAPQVRLRGAVSQAGVLDLVDAADRGVGGGAVEDLMGGSPTDVRDRYALASPAARVPLGVPVVCVHGIQDGTVPIRQSERFVAAARSAGDAAELVALPGVDHFAVIDPSMPAWGACRDAVGRLLA